MTDMRFGDNDDEGKMEKKGNEWWNWMTLKIQF